MEEKPRFSDSNYAGHIQAEYRYLPGELLTM